MTNSEIIRHTERAIRKIPSREINTVLKMTGMYPEKKSVARIIQVDPKFGDEAVSLIRENGIICLYEKYLQNGRFTILESDMKKVQKLLGDKILMK